MLDNINNDLEGSSQFPSSVPIQPTNEQEDISTLKYSNGEKNQEHLERNSEIMDLVISQFPNVGREFVDSNNVNAFHIGLLSERNAEILQNEITATEEYLRLSFGSEKQQEAARLIKELFKSQNDIEGVVISPYGISRHLLFNPLERKDLSNPEEFQTMSILDFDDKALEVFANALNIINEENSKEKELASNSKERIKNAFLRAKGPQNAFRRSSNQMDNPTNQEQVW